MVKALLKMRMLWLREVLRNYAISPALIIKNVRWRRPKTISTQKHVFIVAAPRSGTTLIQAILNAHPETYGFEYETSMFTSQNIFNRKRYTRVLSEQQINTLFAEASDIVSFFDQFVDTLKKDPALRVIEKTPHHITRLGFILKHFPMASVIHVFRDGRDSFCSAKKYTGIRRARHIRTYARYWKKCIDARLRFRDHTQIMDVSYEQFTNDPEKALGRILEFTGLKPYPGLLNTESYSKYFRASNPNFSKLSEPINSGSHGRWRNEMQKEEVEQFEKIAGKQLQALGYALSTDATTKEILTNA